MRKPFSKMTHELNPTLSRPALDNAACVSLFTGTLLPLSRAIQTWCAGVSAWARAGGGGRRGEGEGEASGAGGVERLAGWPDGRKPARSLGNMRVGAGTDGRTNDGRCGWFRRT